jgi:hypothetical protein
MDDPIFELVSATVTMSDAHFTLRGKAAGQTSASVSVSVELGCYNTGYYWGGVVSDPAQLEVKQNHPSKSKIK